MTAPGKPVQRVVVAYATRERQYLWQLELPAGATVAQAIDAARRLATSRGEAPGVPWDDASVGIFGQLCERNVEPRDGDRIELYRALLEDPKEARRQRVARARPGGRVR